MPTRPLTPTEIHEASLVFEGGLRTDVLRVAEASAWPNWPPIVAAWLRRQPAPSTNNAITLGNQCYFPIILHTAAGEITAGDLVDMAWLIHELTHCWQSQHDGPRYLVEALYAQLRYGPRVYDYGGEAGLVLAALEGKRFSDFNREQQGDIARDYYVRRKQGHDTTAWLPYIDVLRSP
jgi:hypothetical protein